MSDPGPAGAVRVVVYTTAFCGSCERAKTLLEARGVAYREERLDRADRERLAELALRARTFPQIVIDGVGVGGYRELVELDRTGRLAELAG